MRAAMEAGGARLDGVYVCVHHPSAGEPPYRQDCDCRKPRPGLLRRAEADLGIDLGRSWMVGDRRRRPGGGLERGGPRRPRAQRLRPGRAGLVRGCAGRASRTWWPITCWRPCRRSWPRRPSKARARDAAGAAAGSRPAALQIVRGRSAAAACSSWPTWWPTSSSTAACSASAARRRSSSSSTTPRTCGWAAAPTPSTTSAPWAASRCRSASWAATSTAGASGAAAGQGHPGLDRLHRRGLRHAREDAHPGRGRARQQAADGPHRQDHAPGRAERRRAAA